MSVDWTAAEAPTRAVAAPHARRGIAPAVADDIVRGQLAPGAALDETRARAPLFSVSRTPVREAIRMLAASGLVEVRAHRAAVVARPTQEHLIGMFEVDGGA